MIGIFVVIHALCGFGAAFPEGVLRMDDNYQYFNHQDIIKAFSKSMPPWYYGHNAESRDVDEYIRKHMFTDQPTCTYFMKESLNNKTVNFTKYYQEEQKEKEKQEKEGKEENEQIMKPKALYGTFFTTPLIENNTPKERTTPNGVTVSTSFGGSAQYGYKLIYSNYKDCHIIRPFPVERVETLQPKLTAGESREHVPGFSYYPPGGSSYASIKPICVVLLGDTQARKGHLPKTCDAVYKNICGTERKLTKVFGEKCPPIPNALGC